MSVNDAVLYQVENQVATITLNRPDKRNALNAQLVEGLKQALTQANADPAVKVVVLTGSGKAFCSGADLDSLQQMQGNTFEQNLADSSSLAELFKLIYNLDKVSIAKINGHALAGGCGLATVCDFSLAVPEARFGYTEVKIGFVPAIVSWFLVRKVGEGIARRLLLSGNVMPAAQALQLGLISEVVEAADLDNAVATLADELCHRNSGAAMASTRHLIAAVQELDLEEGLAFASNMNAHARAHAECRRGIAAFLNKQEIDWRVAG